MRRLILLAALFCSACLPVKPPVVSPPVAAPATYVLAVNVFEGDPDLHNNKPGALVSMVTAANPAGRTGTTDGAGHVWFTLPRGDYDVWCEAEGFLRAEQHVALLAPASINLVLVRSAPPEVTLPRLVARGQFFGLETGAAFTAVEASDFNLFNRYQSGEDIEPVVQQRADAGFNMVRVWTLYSLDASHIGVLLNPDYAKIPAFAQVLARHGIYVEFTAYTSTQDPAHWSRLIEASKSSTNILAELINESDQPANAMDLAPYAQATGLLSSHGSNGAEAWPVQPYWSYLTFHTNGASEEQRKVGHNGMEIANLPVLTNETSRYPDVGMWVGASLDRQEQLAFDSAAGAALLDAGACFHSVAGKSSTPWDAATLAVARAWASGAKSVPLDCQKGAYKHRADLETSDLLRVYQRGDDPACIVKIRK